MPMLFSISLNETELKCTEKLKYLQGCYFQQRSCRIDLNSGICTFYAKVNNILSVIGYSRNELATFHLVKAYCVPTVCTVVKHGIWIAKSIVVLVSYGIILSVRYLVVVGVRVFLFCFIVKLCLCPT